MPGLARRALAAEAVSPAKLIPGLKNNAYGHVVWPSVPPTGVNSTDGFADPAGTTGAINFYTFHGLVPIVAAGHIKGAGQTLVLPTEDATNGYLLAGLDKTLAEGIEYLFGGKQTVHNPFAQTIGLATDTNKFVRMRMALETVANGAECALGFRADTFEANLDDYTDLACLNLQTGDVNIETILNNGGTVTTDTGVNVADAEIFTFEVRMSGNTPRYYVNGQEFRTSMVFDAADVIYPFMFWLQVTGGSDLRWYELTVGSYPDDNESGRF